MDANQVAFFKDRYSRMSNEELANVVVGRHERLSEEANAALTTVLEGKDPATFMREVDEKVEDLNAQARGAAEEIRRQNEHRARSRKALLWFFGALVVILSAVAALRTI